MSVESSGRQRRPGILVERASTPAGVQLGDVVKHSDGTGSLGSSTGSFTSIVLDTKS